MLSNYSLLIMKNCCIESNMYVYDVIFLVYVSLREL